MRIYSAVLSMYFYVRFPSCTAGFVPDLHAVTVELLSRLGRARRTAN